MNIERDFQKLFKTWVESNKDILSNTAFELKFCKNRKPLPFSAVQDHQLVALQEVKNIGKFHKIADQPFIPGRMAYTFKKPFDCFFLKGEAYVVILFYEPYEDKIMYWIDVDVFINEMNTSTRKSLTEDRAKEINSKKFIL